MVGRSTHGICPDTEMLDGTHPIAEPGKSTGGKVRLP
jgi:hypothetical protein